MSHPIRSSLAAAMFALSAATAGAAPPFVPPSEAMPPFRRDKLPIDTDSMASLSREMALLSQSAAMDEASQRRAAAQALALALALDPANAPARDNLSSIAEGKRLRSPDPEVLTRAKARVWQLSGWLATPEAGKDGNLLADLLGDTAAALDPGHPSAAALRDSGERGNWSGWVAPLSGFEERKIAAVEKRPEPVRDAPEPLPSEKKPPGIALSKASVKTVLYAYDEKTEDYLFGNTVVRMEAKGNDDGEHEGEKKEEGGDDEQRERSFRLRVPCREGHEGDIADFIAKPILSALEASATPLPKRGEIRLSPGDGGTYSLKRNSLALTGPGFVLAHAALTGSVPDATVIGAIDHDNRLVSPSHLWYYVTALREGDGGRLVIPAAAEDHFIAILTLDDPEFFLKYEVFAASTPEEFAKLCAKDPESKQAEVSARFQEIRDKAPSNGIGPYLANRFVRQRLLDIHAEMPQHLSAKLLALQGSAERPPRTLPKNVLAGAIWHAVAPLNAVMDFSPYDFSGKTVASMETAQEEAREALDRLDRLTERADTELLNRAKAVISDMRALSRSLSSRNEEYDIRYAAIVKSYDTAKRSNESLRKELALLTGDPPPDDTLDHLRKLRDRNRD